MSIAGGMERAVERGASVGVTALQVFTKSSNQWAARPFEAGEPERFREAVRPPASPTWWRTTRIHQPGVADDALWRKSIDAAPGSPALRGARIPWLVTTRRPYGERGVPGIRRMGEALGRHPCARVPGGEASIAPETTAGQGPSSATPSEQIAAIIAATRRPERPSLSRHLPRLAAGYDLRTPAATPNVPALDGAIGRQRPVW
jgi:deoxyribonuclease-4